jgi:hypothetical protein
VAPLLLLFSLRLLLLLMGPAVGTVAGTAVAFKLVGPQLGPEGYKVAAALCASYIGGSVNFAAVSRSLGLAPGLLAGSMAADNCAMAVYILAIMSIPAEERRPAATATVAPGSAAEPAAARSAGGGGDGASTGSGSGRAAVATAESLALSMAAAALACTLGERIAAGVGLGSSGLAVMALLASSIAVMGSKLPVLLGSGEQQQQQGGRQPPQPQQQPAAPFAGAEALGGALMLLFFSTIGAAAGSLQALQGCGWLVLFIFIQLRCEQFMKLLPPLCKDACACRCRHRALRRTR